MAHRGLPWSAKGFCRPLRWLRQMAWEQGGGGPSPRNPDGTPKSTLAQGIPTQLSSEITLTLTLAPFSCFIACRKNCQCRPEDHGLVSFRAPTLNGIILAPCQERPFKKI